MPEIARLHRRGELRFGGQVDGSGPGCVSGRDQYAVLKDIRSPDGIEVLGAEFHRVVAAADTEVERAAGNERLREHRYTGSETSEHRDAAGKKGTEGTAGELAYAWNGPFSMRRRRRLGNKVYPGVQAARALGEVDPAAIVVLHPGKGASPARRVAQETGGQFPPSGFRSRRR